MWLNRPELNPRYESPVQIFGHYIFGTTLQNFHPHEQSQADVLTKLSKTSGLRQKIGPPWIKGVEDQRPCMQEPYDLGEIFNILSIYSDKLNSLPMDPILDLIFIKTKIKKGYPSHPHPYLEPRLVWLVKFKEFLYEGIWRVLNAVPQGELQMLHSIWVLGSWYLKISTGSKG